MARVWWERVSMEMRWEVGRRRRQRFFTPMARDGDVGFVLQFCGSTLWENAIIGTLRVLGYNTKSQGTNCAGARLKILPSRW